MGIGAIGMNGALYGISAYVYNPNHVTSKSLDKIAKISDDVLDSKLDIHHSSSSENENPLKMEETRNFDAVLEEQIYSGMNRAAMLFGW